MNTQLIGPAGQIESILTLMAEDATMDISANVKVLLYGAPGIGKTELCNRLASQLTGGQAFAVESINGKELDIAKVKYWRNEMLYGNIFAPWSVKIVNEVDRASVDAQVLMLTLLDELPSRRAILATSNLNVGALSDRFQTRFSQYKVAAPSTEELIAFIRSKYPAVSESDCGMIAVGSGGNVRAALADAKSADLAIRAAQRKADAPYQDRVPKPIAGREKLMAAYVEESESGDGLEELFT